MSRSSDSEDAAHSRKKRRHRQRSSSSSSASSRVTGRSRRSRRTRSRDRRRKNRTSSSSSRESSRRRRSRSTGKGRSQRSRRSRSRSRTRRRSRSGSSGRSNRKRSRERAQRKPREKERERTRDREKDKEKRREAGNIRAAVENLAPADQAKTRIQLVLQATARTDESLRAKEGGREEQRSAEGEELSLAEQVRRIKEISAIESEDAFVPRAFKSSRDAVRVTDTSEAETETTTEEVTSLPTAIKYNDSNTLAHPNLLVVKQEAELQWRERLACLRQERLMGNPVA